MNVSNEDISRYLEGRDDEKYIVALESDYRTNQIDLIINDPNEGKKIKKSYLTPFLYMKEEGLDYLCGGNRAKFRSERLNSGIKVKVLNTVGPNGETPDRLKNGYSLMFYAPDKSYSTLLNFFKANGLDVFSDFAKDKKLFITISPVEQYLIQTGKRLFKGMEDYDDVHRLQFDIETSGLSYKTNHIFQIGIKDNRGNEKIIEVTGNTKAEIRDSEREAITMFFNIIELLQPDIVAGYNSEFFDWTFIFGRCDILGIDIKKIALTLANDVKIRRRESMVKFGAETEKFDQTIMWGYNILDVSHAVRRAQAINSDIKGWGLKYITKYADAAKPNRVYVPGGKIHKTWSNKTDKFALNKVNGDWYKISEERPIKEGYEVVKGSEIVDQYLLDDLWETEVVDNKFNQATFLLSKIVPTTLSRTSTMGTASLWKLLMIGWSYENNLAIPELAEKRDFTGGLSRLLEVGYAKDVVKLDYAALYPNIELTHDIFPDLDISGVMKGMLLYIASTRDKYKALKNECEEKGDSKMADLYDKKQLPLKILANSFFGAYGAPYIFNWGDSDCAEETTCRGRQYLRLMVKHFHENYGFRPLVGDSVTKETPVYIKHRDNTIEQIEIYKLFSEVTISVEGQERDFSEKPFTVLTRNGWKTLDYVYRHKTNKKIYRLELSDRVINVTEDHSIFQNGVKVLPSNLSIGHYIDVYDVDLTDNSFNHDEIYQSKILNKEEIFYDDHVYDLSTEDGSFIAGNNGIVCSNTDGFNFAIPETVNEISYEVKGTHRLTEHNKGKVLTGVDAVVADFNEKYMIGRMGLDIDDICSSTINFSRKNYANNILKKTKDGGYKTKLKMVGNTVKSKAMETYIEDFMNEGITLLLDGNGYDFIELYYTHVNKIFNYEIPIAKIASKSKVKLDLDEYDKKCRQVNKAGNPMPRQAHMELIKKHDLKPGLGDTIFYYNIGKTKSHGDIKTIKNKETGETEIELRCKLLPSEEIEKNPDLIIDEYNVPKYLDKFNKRIKPLLVCFSREIRDKIIITTKKDKETKEFILTERNFFDKAQCELTNGEPIKDEDQDDYYEDLMKLEDKEIKFWISSNKIPNNMELTEWEEIKNDYLDRNKSEVITTIENDDSTNELEVEDEPIVEDDMILYNLLLRLEYHEFVNIQNGHLPLSLANDYKLNDIIEYEDFDRLKDLSLDRKMWYILNPTKGFEEWLEDKMSKAN